MFQRLVLPATKPEESQDHGSVDPQCSIRSRAAALKSFSRPHQTVNSCACFPAETQELARGPSELAVGFPLPVRNSAYAESATIHADTPKTTDTFRGLFGAVEVTHTPYNTKRSKSRASHVSSGITLSPPGIYDTPRVTDSSHASPASVPRSPSLPSNTPDSSITPQLARRPERNAATRFNRYEVPVPTEKSCKPAEHPDFVYAALRPTRPHHKRYSAQRRNVTIYYSP